MKPAPFQPLNRCEQAEQLNESLRWTIARYRFYASLHPTPETLRRQREMWLRFQQLQRDIARFNAEA